MFDTSPMFIQASARSRGQDLAEFAHWHRASAKPSHLRVGRVRLASRTLRRRSAERRIDWSRRVMPLARS